MKEYSRKLSNTSNHNLDNKPVCKYHSYDTFPAKVFFDVRDSGNYQLMRPKPGSSTDDLKAIFAKVYDEYFLQMENKDAERWIELRGIITSCYAKIQTIKKMLFLVWSTPPSIWLEDWCVQMRKDQIQAINTLLDEPISVENDLAEEFERVLNIELGILENEINFSEAEMKRMEEDDKATIFNYYEELQAIEDVHGRTLDEKMILPMFVENKKSAIKKATRARMKSLAHGK